MEMASHSASRFMSTEAESSPSPTKALTSSDEVSAMWLRPALMPSTTRSLTSKPMVR
jgi:hypothetical protein